MTISDRTKDVIKSGGEWISSVELENAVMAHPDVFEASVIAVPDPKWSERPLVAVVPKPGKTPSPSDLVDFLAGRVPRWWLPDQWIFIEEIPKTSVGKFDKKLMRAAFADGDYTVQTRLCRSEPRSTEAVDDWPPGSKACRGAHRYRAGRVTSRVAPATRTRPRPARPSQWSGASCRPGGRSSAPSPRCAKGSGAGREPLDDGA